MEKWDAEIESKAQRALKMDRVATGSGVTEYRGMVSAANRRKGDILRLDGAGRSLQVIDSTHGMAVVVRA